VLDDALIEQLDPDPQWHHQAYVDYADLEDPHSTVKQLRLKMVGELMPFTTALDMTDDDWTLVQERSKQIYAAREAWTPPDEPPAPSTLAERLSQSPGLSPMPDEYRLQPGESILTFIGPRRHAGEAEQTATDDSQELTAENCVFHKSFDFGLLRESPPRSLWFDMWQEPPRRSGPVAPHRRFRPVLRQHVADPGEHGEGHDRQGRPLRAE
jgi:hypothetical protein